jgi:hypothetical protein
MYYFVAQSGNTGFTSLYPWSIVATAISANTVTSPTTRVTVTRPIARRSQEIGDEQVIDTEIQRWPDLCGIPAGIARGR